MSIRVGLTVFRWRIAKFDVRIDIDQDAVAATQPVIDGAVKRVSRRWAKQMVS